MSPAAGVTRDSGAFARARAYLAERFPVAPSALLSALYAAGGFAVASFAAPPLVGGRLAAAIGVVLCFFLSLRLADEFKDFERDRLVHPERLVQRGVVTLAELRRAEIAVLLVQAGLAASLGRVAFAAWLAVLAYALLMRVEFFAARWLEPRPITYAATHQPVMLLLTAFVHLAAGVAPARLLDPPLVWHQLLCLAAMFAYEVSRKLRAPGDEHPENRTYSQTHGPRVAGLMAAGLIGLAVVAAERLLGPVAWLAAALVCPALVYAVRPARAVAKVAELAGSLALLALHGALVARLVW